MEYLEIIEYAEIYAIQEANKCERKAAELEKQGKRCFAEECRRYADGWHEKAAKLTAMYHEAYKKQCAREEKRRMQK